MPKQGDNGWMFDIDSAVDRIDAFASARNVADDQAWDDLIGDLFSATNASGLSQDTRRLLIAFFRRGFKKLPTKPPT